MKRLILIITTALLSSYGFSQSVTYLSSSTGRGEVRNQLRLDKQLNNVGGDSVLTTDINGNVKLVLKSGGSYTLPAATTGVRGGVRPDGTTITISGDVISAVGGGSGEPTITYPNAVHKYYTGYRNVFATLNTDSITEGSTNLFLTTPRVQAIGDARYALVGHNHSFDGLTNVSMTGKASGDIPQWNGSAWVKLTPTWITGNQTITLSGAITGSGSTAITTTLANSSVGNNHLTNISTATFKGRATAGTGAVEDLNVSQVKTLLGVTNVDNTTDVSKPVSTATQTALNLKANITSPTFLGTPAAPTATVGTNTTQLATTAFVIANINAGGSGYVLPVAGTSTLGGFKVGTGLAIDGTGILSVTAAGGVSSWNGRTGTVTPQSGDYTTTTVTEGTGLYFTNSRAITSTLTSFTSGAGTVSASDNILQSIQKIVGNLAATNTTVSGKANTSHTHVESDVTNLVSDLAGKASTSATWAASSITSGTLGTARLGTGVANSTSVLFGDNTWKPVPIIDTVFHGSPEQVISTVNTGKDSVVFRPTINVQTGTSYTLLATDAGKVITLSNTSGITVTVPTGLPIGFSCRLIQINTGQVTLVGSSTTINNRQSFTKIAGRWGEAEIFSYATNLFVTKGEMAP